MTARWLVIEPNRSRLLSRVSTPRMASRLAGVTLARGHFLARHSVAGVDARRCF
jgi:hypothetical protein